VDGAANPGLADGEEKILPFPLEHLPPAARDMAEAIAHTERTPETLAGCCVLGFLAASIGAGDGRESLPHAQRGIWQWQKRNIQARSKTVLRLRV
jgi:hypothetical protein